MTREGAYAERVLPDGRELVVYPLTYGRARIMLSEYADSPIALDSW